MFVSESKNRVTNLDEMVYLSSQNTCQSARLGQLIKILSELVTILVTANIENFCSLKILKIYFWDEIWKLFQHCSELSGGSRSPLFKSGKQVHWSKIIKEKPQWRNYILCICGFCKWIMCLSLCRLFFIEKCFMFKFLFHFLRN